MTLFNIAMKNIKKNFYNYFLYFSSMILSILIYFIFTTIQYSNQVSILMGSSRNISFAFKSAAIVVAIFSGIFIWYSNSFFLKKRKKEIALYSMLGVKKKQIGRMLFYENIAIGIIALAIGIFMGSLLSKVFVMLLLKLMGFSTIVKFTIIPKAILNTIISFMILFLITSIYGYSIIYRFKLIELFKAESKGEKVPTSSPFISFISIILIFTGYYIYLKNPATMLITLILVVLGTYLLFSSFIIFFIKISKKNIKRYYNGINMIGTSQLLYRIKGNSRTLATIAVLSASTLTAMGVVSSTYYDFISKQNARYPFSYVVASNNENLIKKTEDIMIKFPENKIEKSIKINFLEYNGNFFNNKEEYIDDIFIISESTLKEIFKIRKIEEKIHLNNEYETIIFDEYYNSFCKEDYKSKTVKLKLNNTIIKFKVVDFKPYPLINQHITPFTIVVKDEVYNKLYNKDNLYTVKAFINKNQKNSQDLTKALKEFASKFKTPKNSKHRTLYVNAYYSSYKDGLIENGILIFIGTFLGLVFLAATGSIIFFKQLSEANDDKYRYKILKNIGVNKKEIIASISKQIFFIFISPLIIGVIHSLVALSFIHKILDLNITIPIITSIGAYTFIYMIYYLLTVSSYYKTVNQE